MRWEYDDGGRKDAGYRGSAKDCVCRAIAIATQRPYEEIYGLINAYARQERRRDGRRSGARTGVFKDTIRKVMADLGWEWIPTMSIGGGCKVHLADGELPMGRLVVAVSKHETAVIDGVIHDTYDCSRGGTRCVYGYYRRANGGNPGKQPAETPTGGEETAGGANTRPKNKPHGGARTARYTQDGHLVLTKAQVKRQAESLIPSELRPYYIGCIIERYFPGPMTAENSDITLQFVKPVCSFGERREIHASLENLPSIMDDLYLGSVFESEVDENYAEYDEEVKGREPVFADKTK